MWVIKELKSKPAGRWSYPKGLTIKQRAVIRTFINAHGSGPATVENAHVFSVDGDCCRIVVGKKLEYTHPLSGIAQAKKVPDIEEVDGQEYGDGKGRVVIGVTSKVVRGINSEQN